MQTPPTEVAQPNPSAALAFASRGAGGHAQPQSAVARRAYARVLKATSDLSSAHEKDVASTALRALRRAEDLTERDAAFMIMHAWRSRKMRRVQAHFAKVAAFDK